MKWLLPVILGMALAVGGWWLWTNIRGDSLRPVNTTPDKTADPFAPENGAARGGPDGPEVETIPGMPEWMIGAVIPGAPSKGRMDGLPEVIGRLEMLTRGRSKAGANTLRLKMEMAQLRQDMLTMSPEESAALAAYFEDCEDPTTKYFLLIAIRSWGGEAFVDVVRDYYEAEPDMVGEALSYMLTRTPSAADAFASLIRDEFDPLRRAKLVSRAGFTCNPASEALMIDLFDRSGRTPERRLALWGLARNGSEEGRKRLQELIDGPEERAAYAIGEVFEQEPELADLRCHGVLAMLMTGGHEEVGSLLERARDGDGDIGHYVDRFFAVVRDPRFVPDVVALLADRGQIDDRYLIYLTNQARPEDKARIAGLLDLAAEGSQRQALQLIIDRLN